MPLFSNPQGQSTATWEPQAADTRLAQTAGASPARIRHRRRDGRRQEPCLGEHATEFLATGTAVRRLAEEHKLPATSPKPTFTLGLEN